MVAVAAKPAPCQGLAAFTYDDIAGLADWRERLVWPIEHSEIAAVGEKVPETMLSFIASLNDGFERQLATLATGALANSFMALLEATWVSARAAALGLEIRGGPPEMPHLTSALPDFEVLEFRGPFAVKPLAHARIRALARVASWTPPWRIPATLLMPGATAVSHNALLRAAAARSSVGYRHAPNILIEARRHRGTAASPDSARTIAERAFDHLLPLVAGLGEPYRARMRRVFSARMANALRLAAADVAAMRGVQLPRRIWSGTNGAYATRIVATEVLRRGGTVDVFDHGGVNGISQLVGSTALIELATATRFHVATPEWAELLSATDAQTLVSNVNRAEIVGEQGEPTFRQAFRDGTSAAGKRRRIIYVGHPFRGLRQPPIATVPDTIYWDFQIDLVEKLGRLPIDLLCKPHPEGYFVGQRNPIERLVPTSYRRFEEHLDDADVFLFDAPTSTTFLESLCTRRPVVLLDRFYRFNPAVAPYVHARCRIVRIHVDERNRLRVDPDELADAVLGAPPEADPAYFRRLTGGRQR